MDCTLRAATAFVVLLLTLEAQAFANPVWSALGPAVLAQAPPPTRCVPVELFVSGNSAQSQKARDDVEQRRGLQLRISDVTQDQDALKRFYALTDKHRVKPGLPLLHACNQVVIGYDQPKTTGARYNDVLSVEVFTRPDCPHCAAAKAFVQRTERTYPGLRFIVFDVVNNLQHRELYERRNRAHGIRVPGLPSFVLGGQFLVGYSTDATTGAQLLKILNGIALPCPPVSKPAAPRTSQITTSSSPYLLASAAPPLLLGMLAFAPPERRNPPAPASSPRVDTTTLALQDAAAPNPDTAAADTAATDTATADAPPPRPPDLTDDSTAGGAVDDDVTAPPPRPDMDSSALPPDADPPAVDSSEGTVALPVFGTLDVRKIGMPLFTILIGLVDGFNPCAMWVLLFMLSILTGLQDRRKILAVAGTFVVVSGLVYFAFMAAWLNVFRLIGLRRSSEIVLAVIAILIGAINIKDFFAFKRGVSLSIPDAAKPGIYARVRGIATAQNLAGAVLGASVLAVLINFIELLCTAGLPALYTKVLTMQGYSLWGEYAYLALYNLAYMFDDSIMVGIAVVTLGRHKLQEREGRWLKFVSGAAIFGMGLTLLFAPHWLV